MDKKRSTRTKYAYHWKKSWRFGNFAGHGESWVVQFLLTFFPICCFNIINLNTSDVEDSVMLPPIETHQNSLNYCTSWRWPRTLPAIGKANPKGFAKRCFNAIHNVFASRTCHSCWNLESFACFNWRSHHCFLRVNHLEVLRQLNFS